jgi:hypothetical protein
VSTDGILEREPVAKRAPYSDPAVGAVLQRFDIKFMMTTVRGVNTRFIKQVGV